MTNKKQSELEKYSNISSTWVLNDLLELRDAAALAAGISPDKVVQLSCPPPSLTWASKDKREEAINEYEVRKELLHKYNGYLSAIRGGVEQGKIKTITTGNTTNLDKQKLDVQSLKEWLAQKNEYPTFFFPTNEEGASAKEKEESKQLLPYLDENHPRYAPELAAAVRAWGAATDSGKIGTKKALKKWLQKHNSLGISKTGIERITTVANWNRKGGAPSSDS